jgi:predicted nucleic acid-binding protein
MKYLLDTCVISELSKKRPHPAVLRWLQARDDLELYVSSVTVGELRKGIERLPDEDVRRQKLEAWFDGFLEVLTDVSFRSIRVRRLRGEELSDAQCAWGEFAL